MPTPLQRRARVAALARHRGADDPVVIEERRSLAADSLAAHIERVVAQAPPLTSEQRARLTALLSPTHGQAVSAA